MNMFLIYTMLLLFIKKSCKNEGNMHDKVRYVYKKSLFTIVVFKLFSHGCNHVVTYSNPNLANKSG